MDIRLARTSGGGGNAFGIVQPDTGTSPNADSATDTLTVTSSDGSVKIGGDSTTDTVDWTRAGQKKYRQAKSADYTLTTSDYYIGVTSTAATRTMTLPSAASCGSGFTFIIKDESGACSINNIIIDGNASETIDGSTTYKLSVNYEAVEIICDGSNWFVI